MIYPPKVITGTQRILLSMKKRRRLKRKQCALLSNEKSVIQSLRKKRNHNKILHIASNGVLKSLIPAETYWYKSCTVLSLHILPILSSTINFVDAFRFHMVLFRISYKRLLTILYLVDGIHVKLFHIPQ